MTLREKIFKMFIVTIREINKHGGPERFFKEYPVGGMYYGEESILRDENGTEIGTQFSFETRGIEADIKRHIYDVHSQVAWQDDIDALQAPYDLVLFNIAANHGTWSVPLMLIWASHQFDKAKKVIVHYGNPYFAEDYFPEDPTYIEMNCRTNKTSAKALVDRIFGDAPFTGVPRLL